MDVANTLASQSNMYLENYSSSLVELPPSISNIYATNDLAPESGSRFSQHHGGSMMQQYRDSQPSSSLWQAEDQLFPQQVPGNDPSMSRLQ